MNDLLNKRKPYVIFNACLYFLSCFLAAHKINSFILGKSCPNPVGCPVQWAKPLAFRSYKIFELILEACND